MGNSFLKKSLGKLQMYFSYLTHLDIVVSFLKLQKNAGIEYFVTIKIAWSNFNKFPNHTFYWKGIDGTSIFCHFPPADTYMSFGEMDDVMNTVTKHRDKGRSNCSLLLFGDGDGGGGP